MSAAGFADHIRDLSIILSTAAVTSLISQRLKQPPVLGYLLAGIILGPHVPGIVLGGEGGEGGSELTHSLSELGVILLMFTIGLEFNLRKIARIGPVAGFTAVVEVGLMLSLGFVAARVLGFNSVESLFVGACVGISSTMLVAKAFEEQKLKGGFAEVVFGVLVFEDIIAILLLAVLTAVSSGGGLTTGEFALEIGKLLGFLIALLAIGLLVVPRFIRGVVRLSRSETTLIAGIAVCFTMATLAAEAGYSVALGAFLAGMLVSESGEGGKVEHLVQPLRDIFAAIFFIAVGLSINPMDVVTHWLPVVVLTVLVLVGKTVGVALGAFLTGNGVKHSVRSGMSLAQIGEFSFIIAGLGIARGATGSFIYPVAVAVSLLTSLTTPWMVRNSERIADAVDRRLPARLQTFVTFYEAWIEQLKTARGPISTWQRIRRTIILLGVDAVLLIASLAGARLVRGRVVEALEGRFTLPSWLVEPAFTGATLLVAAIFFVGVIRQSVNLANILARIVMPERPSDGTPRPDLGAAPRNLIIVVFQLALGLAVGLPLVAITQPFVPPGSTFAVFALIIIALAVNAWRSIKNLQGHVRAGAELVVEMLGRQSRRAAESHHGSPAMVEPEPTVEEILPGLPGMTAVQIVEGSAGLGRSISQLNLRLRTGVAILTIHRPDGTEVPQPITRHKLALGEVVTLAGSREAVDHASEILQKGPAVDPKFLSYAG
ncbi:cation:proton antiporter [Nannocystis sp. RBIL2]|uniref:cation:proton antiporter n=1 Tax=Nannocystis sp. RBIL2 TaxID=2996788 RepID=UPI00226F3915|nr:cation:proton antiporter [Nannocystis sp. RBIL2]MCY1063953.1 cation:proton antiporter [Nannocystis sp. RBIL2]